MATTNDERRGEDTKADPPTTASGQAGAANAPTLEGDSRTVLDTGGGASVVEGGSGPRPAPTVPGHELLRCIGRGSYGEVWLARNVMGTYRAVKIVYRETFQHARPFEREFNGIKKFEPISRSHEGLVDVLQVGRNDDSFHYVMEVADDVATGQEIDPAAYTPKTLRSEVTERGCLAFERCVEVALSLTQGLGHMHKHGLIHRDIKPSNIVFVHGVAKLADIGLVAEQSEAKSFVGTEGFIPPEGPGTMQADIYSLGKVIYEMATGKDRHEFPALPTLVGDPESDPHLLELNAVFLKACQSDLRHRYGDCEQMRADLLLLQSGKSVKRAQKVERRLAVLTKLSVAGVLVTLMIAMSLIYVRNQARREAGLRAHAQDEQRRAEMNALAARRNAYASDLSLAQQALQGSNLGRALELLTAQIPGPGELDLRGWEWRYLWAECRGGSTLLCGLGGSIHSVGFVPGSSSVLVATDDGSVGLWDGGSRRAVRTFSSPGSHQAKALVSPDGRHVVVSRSDSGVHLLDAADGSQLGTITPEPQHVIALSQRGDLLAAANWGSGEVTLWRIPAGTVLWRHGLRPNSTLEHGMGMSLAPTGGLFAVGDAAGVVHLYDVQSGVWVTNFAAHSRGVIALAFSPDGNRLVSTGGYGEYEVKVWDVTSGAGEVGVLRGHTAWVSSLAFSPDGRVLASGCADQTIRLWNTETWRLQTVLRGHRQEVWTLAWDSTGTTLASGSKDGEVRLWDVDRVRARPPSPVLLTNVASFTPAPDGGVVAAISRDGSVGMIDLRQLAKVAPVPQLGAGNTVCVFTPDSQSIVAAGRKGQIQVYDRVREAVVASFTAEPGDWKQMRFVSEGARLALSGGSRISLWSTKPWAHSRSLELRGTVEDVSSDGRAAVTRDLDDSLTLWELDAVRETATIRRPHHWLTQARFSPDGKTLASCGSDGWIRLWETPGGRAQASLRGHLLGVFSLEFSADGERLFSGSNAGEAVKAWNVATRRETITLAGADQLFRMTRVSADGTVLGSVNRDGELHLWRAPSWAELEPLAKLSPQP